MRPTRGGYRCARCLLAVRPGHRAQAARASCPVPVADAAEQMAYRVVRQRLRVWAAWTNGVVPPPPEPAGYLGGRLRVFRPHYLLRAGAQRVCLRCGLMATRVRGLEQRACVPCTLLPQRVLDLLLRGALDADLEGAPGWVRARAVAAGWRDG